MPTIIKYDFDYIECYNGESDVPPIRNRSRNEQGSSPLAAPAHNSLSYVQVLLLYKIKDNTYSTITQTIAALSEENKLPRSTLRSNANKLRKMGLIDCGTMENKGVPVMLTISGQELVRIMDRVDIGEKYDR